MQVSEHVEQRSDPPSPPEAARPGRAAWVVLAALVLGSAIAMTLLYPRSWTGRQPTVGARTNMAYVFSTTFAEGEGFKYPLTHFDRLPPDIARALTPRDAAIRDSYTVPKDFAGVMLVYGIAQWIWQPLAIALSPILAALTLLLVAALSRELFGRGSLGAGLGRRLAVWLPVVAAAAWLVHPAFPLVGSRVYSNDLLALPPMLAAVLYFVRFWRRDRERDFIWMIAWVGVAVTMRYPNILVVLPIAAALLASKRVTIRRILLGAAVMAPFVLLIAAFNLVVYGSPTTTGYAIGSDLMRATAGQEMDSFFQFVPGVVRNHAVFYLAKYPMMLLPQVLGGALAVWLAWRRREERGLILAIFGICAVLGLYYVGREGLGSTDARASASFLRYVFPVTALFTIFLVYGLVSMLRRTPALALGIIGALIAACAWTAWSIPSGFSSGGEGAEDAHRLRMRVQAITEPDAIVAARAVDAGVFPERQTITLTYLVTPDQNVAGPEGGRRRIWEALPTGERFATVASVMQEREIPFYLIERQGPRARRLLRLFGPALEDEGLRLRFLERIEGKMLYRVEPIA